MKVTQFCKENKGLLLTIGGCVAMVMTTGLSIRAGMKIADILKDEESDTKTKRKEIVKESVIPAVGLVTAVSLVGMGSASDRRLISELVDKCMVSGLVFSNYRQEVIKRYGKEVDADILNTVCGNPEYHCLDNSDIPDVMSRWLIDFGIEELPLYEIKAYERDIIHAEYHFNRNYVIGYGDACINQFLYFFGLQEEGKDVRADICESYGWTAANETYFVDFIHEKIDSRDDIPTYKIYPLFAPESGYDCP